MTLPPGEEIVVRVHAVSVVVVLAIDVVDVTVVLVLEVSGVSPATVVVVVPSPVPPTDPSVLPPDVIEEEGVVGVLVEAAGAASLADWGVEPIARACVAATTTGVSGRSLTPPWAALKP